MGHLITNADAARIPLPDRSVSLVFGSPSYIDARTYGRAGISRGLFDWCEWMMGVTAEALRVSSGLVLWVVAGVTRDHCYQPGPEMLLSEWRKRGIATGIYQDGIELHQPGHCCRSAYWHRYGIPGSGGKYWLRADVETVLAFKRPGPLAWADPTAMGHPPKWAPGGEMSHRLRDGERANQWGMVAGDKGMRRANGTYRTHSPGKKLMTRRDASRVRDFKKMKGVGHETLGTSEPQYYIPPVMANPGNLGTFDYEASEADWLLSEGLLVHTQVGGGQLGHAAAHLNEAPFPEALAEFFVRSFSPEGGIVLDCFGGSGTTASVAERFGRIGLSMDLRWSQCELARRRIQRPHAALPPNLTTNNAPDASAPLFANLDD